MGAALCEPAAVLPAGGPLNKGSVSFCAKRRDSSEVRIEFSLVEVKVALPRAQRKNLSFPSPALPGAWAGSGALPGNVSCGYCSWSSEKSETSIRRVRGT